MPLLQPLAENLWDYNAPLSVLGMQLGHRMSVVRLPGGALWVHSPVACEPAIRAELAGLGPVAHIVAPNCVHDTYLEGWFAAYPDASFHGAPGLPRNRPDLKFTATLGKSADPAWAGTLDQLPIRGMPRVNEIVFLHRPTRTLILTDLAFNLGPDMPLLSRVLLRINGCYCQLRPSRLLLSTVKDRAAFRASLDAMLAWDFDRVLLSHGANLRTGGRERLREALAFL